MAGSERFEGDVEGHGYRLLLGDALERLRGLESGSVHCVVTSPPYWGLRDYGVDGQIGLEGSPGEHVSRLVEVFAEVRRVLRADGCLWLNYGDAYTSGDRNGHGTRVGYKQQTNRGMNGTCDPARAPQPPGLKPKDLIGLPWRLAFALQEAGWWLRCDVIWAKPNPMPESVTDRPTRSHEYVFLLAKSERYFYDADAVREQGNPFAGGGPMPAAHRLTSGGEFVRASTAGKWSEEDPQSSGRRIVENVKAARKNGGGHDSPFGPGRNRRSVWTIPTAPYPEAHFATFPPDLVRPCILAGTSERGVCPACGAPWRRVVEREGEWRAQHNRQAKHNGAVYRTNPGGGVAGANVKRTSLDLGWQPTCPCDAGDPVAATVLDPFAGSATVGVVALEYGRNFVGIELNPEYVAMAERRLRAPASQPLLDFFAPEGLDTAAVVGVP